MIDDGRYEYVIVSYKDKQSEHLEAALDTVVGNRRLVFITPLTKERLLLTIENSGTKGRYESLEKDMKSIVEGINGGADV